MKRKKNLQQKILHVETLLKTAVAIAAVFTLSQACIGWRGFIAPTTGLSLQALCSGKGEGDLNEFLKVSKADNRFSSAMLMTAVCNLQGPFS